MTHFTIHAACARAMRISVAALCALSCHVAAADTIPAPSAAEKPVKLKVYGFVRDYICFDTRQCVTTNGEMFNIIPEDVRPDADGEDLNAVPQIDFTVFTTRLGLDASGPEIAGARTSAKIEADFCGFGNNNTMLRVRHAYARFDFPHLKLIAGQTWHPMTDQVMPSVVGMATGAPFNPFSRTPQLRAEWEHRSWLLTGALLYQLPNTSVGPDGATYEYQRHGLWPEVYASVERSHGHLMLGAGVDIISLMPRTEGVDAQGRLTKVHSRVTSASPEVFAEYKRGDFEIKGKVVYASNTAHLTMVSGYGASAYDPATGAYEYSPIRSVTGWVNALWGSRLRWGVFGGYMHNLGSRKDFVSTADYWMRAATNISYIWRVSPSVVYTTGPLALGLELEYTVAGYGSRTINADTRAERDVDNLRVCSMIKYSF